MSWEKFISAGIRMPFYMEKFIRGLKEDVSQKIGLNVNDWVSVTDQQLTSIYYDRKNNLATAEKYFDKRLSDKKFTAQLPKLFRKIDENLLKFCRTLYFCDLAQVKKSELLQMLKKFSVLYQTKFGFYPLPKLFSDALVALLPKKVRFKISEEELSILIASDTISDYVQDRLALLSISESIKEKGLVDLFNNSNEEIIQQLGRFHPQLYARIENYSKEFNWVPVNHHVQPLNLDLAFGLVREAIKDSSSPEELAGLKKRPGSVIEERKKVLKKFKFNSAELNFLNFFREINSINESRKSAMSKPCCGRIRFFRKLPVEWAQTWSLCAN